VDLGVPFATVEHAVAALGLQETKLHLWRDHAGPVSVMRFDVEFSEAGPERAYADIDDLIARAELEPVTQEMARRIFRRLAEAEAAVHGVPLDRVHFHEVGAVDAIVDIVGAAACLSYLGSEVVASPLPMGRGKVDSRHGILPLPAPATLECLRGVPTYDAEIDAELVTPTGAAIVSTIAQRFERWPEFAPERIGWGGGSRRLPDRPNALRVVLGRRAARPEIESGFSHVVVETNVDDLTGELAAHAIEGMLAAGALDAWATPMVMKKGRPGLTLAALATREAADRIAEVLLRETSSIGVRRLPVQRTERPRRMISVDTRFGPIPVKISAGPWGPPQIKPEFDACANIARSAGVPVREVLAEALRKAYESIA
jgi:uncharacterized protein (TIGR00299 family) protein